MEPSGVTAGGRPVSSPLACGVECKMLVTTKVRLLKSMLLVVHRCSSYLQVCYNGFPTPHTPSSSPSPSPSQPPAITIYHHHPHHPHCYYRFHHTQVQVCTVYLFIHLVFLCIQQNIQYKFAVFPSFIHI
jgi:hypothetical protein